MLKTLLKHIMYLFLIVILYKQKSQQMWETIMWFQTRKTLSKVKDTTWIWGRKKHKDACARLIQNTVLFYFRQIFVNCPDAATAYGWFKFNCMNSTSSYYFPLLYTYIPSLLEGILCVICKATSWTHWTFPTYSYVHDNSLSTFPLASVRVCWAKWRRSNKVGKAQNVEWSSTKLASNKQPQVFQP